MAQPKTWGRRLALACMVASFITLLTCSALLQYDLSIHVSPSGSGSVEPPSGSYASGTVVTLTATPATGYVFDQWDGDLTGSKNPATLTMTGDSIVYADFKLDLRATFNMTSWNQPYYSSLNKWGSVEVYYEVENVCPNTIDYYEVYFDVTCSDGSVYSGYDNGVNLKPNKKYASYTYVDVGQKKATGASITDSQLTAY